MTEKLFFSKKSRVIDIILVPVEEASAEALVNAEEILPSDDGGAVSEDDQRKTAQPNLKKTPNDHRLF